VIAFLAGTSIVTNFAEFTASPAVSSVGGVHTVTGAIYGSGTITFPVGDTVVFGETGFITSDAYNKLKMVFDVDASAVSGPVVMYNVEITNTNVGPSSWCLEISSTLGRLPIFNFSAVFGLRGVRVANVLGPATILVCAALSPTSAIGWEFAGVIGAAACTRVSSLLGAPSQVGVRLDPTLTIVGFLSFQAMVTTLSLPTQFAVAIDDAITVLPGAQLHWSSSSNNGPQGSFFRQDPGDMSIDDVRLVAKGNPSAADWTANADVGRLDIVNQLDVVLPAAPSDPVPIPYEDGVTPLEIEADSLVRFGLFKDAGDPDRWWVEYTGTITAARGQASWSILVDRSAGTGTLTGCVEANESIVVSSCQLDDGGVFTDFTAEAQSAAADDVPLLPSPLATDDAVYFGSTSPFETVKITVSQAGVGTYTLVWEYWDGATWVAVVGLVDGTVGFTAAPGVYDVDHTPQPGWASTTVNSVMGFYLRARANPVVSLATQPRATQVSTYAGFAVIASTVGAIENTNQRLQGGTAGNVTANPGDRFRPALQNQTGVQTARVWQVKMDVRVFP
jgi:hypothetical protein